MIYVCITPGIKKWDEPEQIKNILEDLDKYKNKIVGLELCHNSIGEKCAEALGEKIKNLKNLRKVDLSDCFVTRGKKELPKCLKYLFEALLDKPIKELILSNNALGPNSAEGYEFFFEKNKSLEKLILNDCGMGPIGTPSLMNKIKGNKNIPLKVLKIARNKMETTGCKSICELVKEKKTLKEISISDNEIDGEGLKLFFDSIKDNENITYIDTHNNSFSNEGKMLPEIIGTLKNIVHLDLSDQISDKDICKKIIETLPNLNKLRFFSFEYNISSMDLGKNRNKYISELLDCLLNVNNLKELHFENNEIPEDIYSKYSPKFKSKGLYLFSCYGEEEKMDDLDNDDIDYTDLNKK